MGNQKEFIASVDKLKKQFEFACETAIHINHDRLKHLDKIETLEMRISIYEKALKNISIQQTCSEQEEDEERTPDENGSRLGDIECGYDTIIEVAREAIKKANQKEDKQ